MSHEEPPSADAGKRSQSQARLPWSTSLWDCFSDFESCCLTLWCPCATFGRVSEIVDRGSSSCGVNGAMYVLISLVTWFPCIYACFYRSKMREQYSLQEYPCPDLLVHTLCHGCALCQEYRELHNRGYNMILGWHGNVERQSQGVVLAPLVHEPMTK